MRGAAGARYSSSFPEPTESKKSGSSERKTDWLDFIAGMIIVGVVCVDSYVISNMRDEIRDLTLDIVEFKKIQIRNEDSIRVDLKNVKSRLERVSNGLDHLNEKYHKSKW